MEMLELLELLKLFELLEVELLVLALVEDVDEEVVEPPREPVGCPVISTKTVVAIVVDFSVM